MCRYWNWSVRCVLVASLFAATSCKKIDPPGTAAGTLPVITTKSGAEMVLVPAGRFRMGSGSGKADESPVHEVQIDAFLMDRYEMTQGQYTKLVPINGSHFKGPNNPVEMISWPEAALFCNLRSRAEGLKPCYDEETGACNFEADGYRLPTEAEWEYACRAGSDAEYAFGDDARLLRQYGWFVENASKKTQPVGQKKPNAWGLYDMYGNVAEWCNDIYEKGYYAGSPAQNPRGPTGGVKRVLRGGAWNSPADCCRSAYRVGEDPGFEDACFARDAIGFRCVRKAPSPSNAKTCRQSRRKVANPRCCTKAGHLPPSFCSSTASTLQSRIPGCVCLGCCWPRMSSMAGGIRFMCYCCSMRRRPTISRCWPCRSSRRKAPWLILSIVNDLGLLGFFKYGKFVAENLNALLSLLGVPYEVPMPGVLFPIGISFFIFQSMTYTIDYYRGKVERETNFLRYATFVGMFPQLLSGPIERARNMLPQLRQAPVISRHDVADGLSLFVVGLFKKVALADFLAHLRQSRLRLAGPV